MDENAPSSSSPKRYKRRKPLRSRFKRCKNDERKAQAGPRNKHRVLESISTNTQQTPVTLEILAAVNTPGWTVSSTKQRDALQFCILNCNPPSVVRSVTVTSDLTWYVHVLGKVVPRPNAVIQNLPARVTSETCLLHILSSVHAVGTAMPGKSRGTLCAVN